MQKVSFFIIEKLNKNPKCPALQIDFMEMSVTHNTPHSARGKFGSCFKSGFLRTMFDMSGLFTDHLGGEGGGGVVGYIHKLVPSCTWVVTLVYKQHWKTSFENSLHFKTSCQQRPVFVYISKLVLAFIHTVAAVHSNWFSILSTVRNCCSLYLPMFVQIFPIGLISAARLVYASNWFLSSYQNLLRHLPMFVYTFKPVPPFLLPEPPQSFPCLFTLSNQSLVYISKPVSYQDLPCHLPMFVYTSNQFIFYISILFLILLLPEPPPCLFTLLNPLMLTCPNRSLVYISKPVFSSYQNLFPCCPCWQPAAAAVPVCCCCWLSVTY